MLQMLAKDERSVVAAVEQIWKRDTWDFRQVQFRSASLYAPGHGGNGAQKTMGIITVLFMA
jgi:hypothetical protein